MLWHSVKPDQKTLRGLIGALQVEDVQIVELHSSAPDHLKWLRPIYGLILFSECHASDIQDDRPFINSTIPSLFFAHQVEQNACASHAILSVLLNAPQKVNLSPQLAALKEVTKNLSHKLTGKSVENSKAIQSAHNHVAMSNCLPPEGENNGTCYNYSYKSFLTMKGLVYELDGQKCGPVILGQCFDWYKHQKWLNIVHLRIEKLMAEYLRKKISFHLVAVREDRTALYTKKMMELREMKKELLPITDEEVEKAVKDVESRIRNVDTKLLCEGSNFSSWRQKDKN